MGHRLCMVEWATSLILTGRRTRVQTSRVISTIRWMESTLSKNVKENIISSRLLTSKEAGNIDAVFAATHDWARDA